MTSDLAGTISWLGHDGFKLEAGGKCIVIDPYELTSGGRADLILITHAHYDHCSPEDIAKFQGAGTVIVTEPESARKVSGDVRIMRPGETIEVDGVTIEAVPAYNIGKKFHPKKKNWLGFVITLDGVRIYHAGDTDLIEEMDDLKVDVALLPVSGTYVMTADEAVEAAKRIKPRIAIPMHFDSLVGTAADADRFAAGLQGVCEVRILPRL